MRVAHCRTSCMSASGPDSSPRPATGRIDLCKKNDRITQPSIKKLNTLQLHCPTGRWRHKYLDHFLLFFRSVCQTDGARNSFSPHLPSLCYVSIILDYSITAIKTFNGDLRDNRTSEIPKNLSRNYIFTAGISWLQLRGILNNRAQASL